TWPARACSDLPPAITVDPDQPAYTLFTSGSTGEPKAVVTSHEPVAHFVDWQIREFGLSRGDRFSHLSGIGHDPFLRDVFTPLRLGATACVPPPQECDLASWFRRARVTVSHLTPGIARLLAQSGIPSSYARMFFLGGDRVRADDVQNLRRWAPGARCVNFYGATETPQAVGCFEIPPEGHEVAVSDPVPIGHGAAGAQLLVVNPSQHLAGIGELGEILVRTNHLSRGYLGDADATRERFVTSPFTGRTEDQLYRTGDLGHYRHDGAVVFAGRADRQVKVRGYRVEPAGIEAAIQRHPRIRQVALHARAAKGNDQELVAYYVTDGAPLEPDTLRSHLTARLAPFEVPQRFVQLPELPLNRHGKVDFAALERMAPLATAESGANNTAPRTETERRLARVWAEVLQRDEVGVNADFFELGGHSLLGLRLVERVQGEFHQEISLRTLFENRTVADMARRLEPKAEETAKPSPPASQQLRGADRGVPLFVVPGYFGIGYMRPSLASVIGGVCPYYDRFRYAGVGDQ
ncbi:MAG: non-ribosomal peptide synthetase, partial [Nitrospira sp.]|nr:non-ribosomal peptide synthetase [Nitrospira sp.]